jgi:uncharacterized integral membrane protein
LLLLNNHVLTARISGKEEINMPWRLIGFIVLFGIVLVFIAFNLGNTSDISFGFKVFSGVPVYFIVFASFILGLLSAVPSIVSSRLRKKEKPKEGEKPPKAPKKGKGDGIEELPSGEGPYGID